MVECAYKLIVDYDELEVRLETVERAPDSLVSRSQVDEQLKDKHVSNGINQDTLADALARLPSIETPGEVIVIAKGARPKHGEHGRIDFKVDVSGSSAYRGEEFSEEEGSIDFRDAVRLVSVNPGDIIGELLPPTKGQPGRNLAGQEIPARDGKAIVVRLGEGVEFDEGSNQYLSTSFGRPIYRDGGLYVSPVYEVAADVDFNTGNISFKGHVFIGGNVQDGFSITAESLEIVGVIGACQISCGGDLTVNGGVNGRDKALIQVGGSARIEAHGDVSVAREVVNSTVWCLGQMRAGKIIGGECLAFGGVYAGFLGSDLGVETKVSPGTHYGIRRLEQAIVEVEAELEQLLRPVLPFFGDRARFKGLAEEKKKEYRGIYEKFLGLKKKHVGMSQERRRIIESEEHEPVKQAIVLKMVYPDVHLFTDKCSRRFTKPTTGPAALVEDIANGRMRAAPYSQARGVVLDETLDGEGD